MRFVLADQFRRTDLRHTRQFFPQSLGQISHLAEICDATLMHPFEDLVHAKAFFTDSGEKRCQLVSGKPQEIDFFCLGLCGCCDAHW